MALHRPTSVALSPEDRARVVRLASVLGEKAAAVGAVGDVSRSHVLRAAVRLGLDALERQHGIDAAKARRGK